MSNQNYKEIDKGDYILTNYHVPTRRAVMWLGQTCNINCYFCYFSARIADKSHPEHPFMTIDKAKEICRIFREKYDLNSIDIQGGEPTIYPQIFELLDFCNEIGLKPTLITNLIALNNYKYCEKFKTHGVYDFLVSLQAVGDVYDKIVDVKNGFKRQMEALENIQKLEIPIRINTVLSNEAIPQLKEICDLAIKYKARVVNFLGYNNSGDQDRIRKKEKVPYYREVSQILEPLIDYLEASDIEVNVRFFPFCVFKPKYRKNIQNQKQKIFDIHEWEVSSRIWVDAANQRQAKQNLDPLPNLLMHMNQRRIKNFKISSLVQSFIPSNVQADPPKIYQKKIEQMIKCYKPLFNEKVGHVDGFSNVEYFYHELNDHYNHLSYVEKCKGCDVYPICDGLYCDYIKHFGDGDIKPIKDFGKKIYDSKIYLNEQMKVVEKQEADWAFPKISKMSLQPTTRSYPKTGRLK